MVRYEEGHVNFDGERSYYSKKWTVCPLLMSPLTFLQVFAVRLSMGQDSAYKRTITAPHCYSAIRIQHKLQPFCHDGPALRSRKAQLPSCNASRSISSISMPPPGMQKKACCEN